MSTTLEPSAPDLAPLDQPDLFDAHLAAWPDLPDWLRAQKQAAWEQYRSLPMPTRRSETWRFANLRRLEAYAQHQPAREPVDAATRAAILERSHRLPEVAGRLVFADDSLLAAEVPEELAAQGVVFLPLVEALHKHPEAVRQHFMQQSPELGSDKFEALHLALLRNGVYLHVPQGVEIAQPFVVYHWAVQDGAAIFPHSIFVCEEKAHATLIEFQEGYRADREQFIVANSDIFAGAEAQPRHYLIQNWTPRSLSFQLNTSNAQRQVESRSLIFNVGSLQARQEIHGKIFGQDSNIEIASLSVPRGEQEFDQRTLQTHDAPSSRSDLLFKNALLDNSRTIFSGLIIVEPDAQLTDAYQTNNNLMLSDTAESNSLPGLEIQANDVKCSHGATTGRIDDSNLFYFLARGIPRKKAEELMVFGFFEEIISKIEHSQLADYVRALVQDKFRA
jgi:Fe-S cluster assembly protein SufD